MNQRSHDRRCGSVVGPGPDPAEYIVDWCQFPEGASLSAILILFCLSTAASSGQGGPVDVASPGAVTEESPDSAAAPVADPAPAGPVTCPGWIARSPGEESGFLIDLPEWLETLASGGLAGRLTGLDDLQIRLSPWRIVLGTGFDFSL